MIKNKKKLLEAVEKKKNILCSKLDMDGEKIKVKVDRTVKGMGGIAKWKRKVGLSKKLIQIWDEDPNICFSVLGHELIHLKYHDNRHFMVRISTILPFTAIARAKILLIEMRANIEGMAILNLNNNEIDRVQDKLRENNYSPKRKKSYKQGYPEQSQIADFAKRYKVFDDVAKKELLTDFCDVMKINDSSKFISKVISVFNKKYN
ncbi:M48 family metalloprotease [Rummeliibacillus stabekisii]|uniref:hypothetical protein n=1 Tax=Rummeliibacillus stabekisii TaxID=241244 RepID=UPI0037243D52